MNENAEESFEAQPIPEENRPEPVLVHVTDPNGRDSACSVNEVKALLERGKLTNASEVNLLVRNDLGILVKSNSVTVDQVLKSAGAELVSTLATSPGDVAKKAKDASDLLVDLGKAAKAFKSSAALTSAIGYLGAASAGFAVLSFAFDIFLPGGDPVLKALGRIESKLDELKNLIDREFSKLEKKNEFNSALQRFQSCFAIIMRGGEKLQKYSEALEEFKTNAELTTDADILDSPTFKDSQAYEYRRNLISSVDPASIDESFFEIHSLFIGDGPIDGINMNFNIVESAMSISYGNRKVLDYFTDAYIQTVTVAAALDGFFSAIDYAKSSDFSDENRKNVETRIEGDYGKKTQTVVEYLLSVRSNLDTFDAMKGNINSLLTDEINDRIPKDKNKDNCANFILGELDERYTDHDFVVVFYHDCKGYGLHNLAGTSFTTLLHKKFKHAGRNNLAIAWARRGAARGINSNAKNELQKFVEKIPLSKKYQNDALNIYGDVELFFAAINDQLKPREQWFGLATTSTKAVIQLTKKISTKRIADPLPSLKIAGLFATIPIEPKE